MALVRAGRSTNITANIGRFIKNLQDSGRSLQSIAEKGRMLRDAPSGEAVSLRFKLREAKLLQDHRALLVSSTLIAEKGAGLVNDLLGCDASSISKGSPPRVLKPLSRSNIRNAIDRAAELQRDALALKNGFFLFEKGVAGFLDKAGPDVEKAVKKIEQRVNETIRAGELIKKKTVFSLTVGLSGGLMLITGINTPLSTYLAGGAALSFFYYAIRLHKNSRRRRRLALMEKDAKAYHAVAYKVSKDLNKMKRDVRQHDRFWSELLEKLEGIYTRMIFVATLREDPAKIKTLMTQLSELETMLLDRRK